MALDRSGLAAALAAVFDDTSGKDAATKADEIADAIDAYVLAAIVEVSIPAGTVAASAVIPAGAVSQGASPAVITNPLPIPITITFNASPIAIHGDPDATPGTDTAGGLS